MKKDLLGLLDGRETFVIDKAGTILLAYNNQARHLLLPCSPSVCFVCTAGSLPFTVLVLYSTYLHAHHCRGRCSCRMAYRTMNCVPSCTICVELYLPRSPVFY